MHLLRVEVEYIIQGIRDRKEVNYYGNIEHDNIKLERMSGTWWENSNETLMRSYTFYAPKDLVEYKEKDGCGICIDKRTNEELYRIPIHYNWEYKNTYW